MPWKSVETYRSDESKELAQRLFDSGLIYWVNVAVLHPHGFALGVVVDDESTNEVKGLSLCETDDPLGIWFDESETEKARQKLLEAGLLHGRTWDK